MPLYPCAICGRPVEKPEAWRKRTEHVFCSDKCRSTPFIPKRCEICGNTFYVTAQSAGQAKFCSAECRHERDRKEQVHKHGKLVTKTCERCGKEFSVRASVAKVQRYCSQKCSGAVIGENHTGTNSPVWKDRITVVCAYCGKEFETYPSRNGRRKYCCNKHRILGNLKRLASGERTDIEVAMSTAPRKNRIAFDEQVVMFGKFMVDFKLSEYPIIVQCDGVYWHDRPKAKAKDKGQDAYLVKAGYVVLRFTDRQILHEMSTCIKTIKQTIKSPHQPRLIQG